jgi:putative cell wall-binding protein
MFREVRKKQREIRKGRHSNDKPIPGTSGREAKSLTGGTPLSIRKTRTSKRWMMAAAAAAVCASAVAVSSGGASAATDGERIGGDDRYETAALISEELDDCYITVASGEDFPDGIAAGPLDRTILLTRADSLPAATADELDRLIGTAVSPGTCWGTDIDIKVVGGTSAISFAVYTQLEAYPGPIERLAGLDRYKTAIAIGTFQGASSNKVIMATGSDFPDALAAGPFGISTNMPILLNDGPTVRADVGAFLVDEAITMVSIVGGPSAVPDTVILDLASTYGITAERISGDNRNATAVAIAEEYALGAHGQTLVNGLGFADALAASTFSADNSFAPIVLGTPDRLPAPTCDFLKEESGNLIDDIWAMGGTAAISNATLDAAVACATPSPALIVSATLATTDVSQAIFTIPGTTGTTVLTAVPGGLIDGPNGNFWTVKAVNHATETGVAIDSATRSFTVKGPFDTSVTQAEYQAIWNASSAAAFMTAAPGTAGAFTNVPANGVLTTVGQSDLKVVVTFDRKIGVPTAYGLHPNSNTNPANSPELLGSTTIAANTAVLASDLVTMTYTWDDVTTATPTLPNGQVRFPVASVTPVTAGIPNPAVLAETMVAP